MYYLIEPWVDDGDVWVRRFSTKEQLLEQLQQMADPEELTIDWDTVEDFSDVFIGPESFSDDDQSSVFGRGMYLLLKDGKVVIPRLVDGVVVLDD